MTYTMKNFIGVTEIGDTAKTIKGTSFSVLCGNWKDH